MFHTAKLFKGNTIVDEHIEIHSIVIANIHQIIVNRT